MSGNHNFQSESRRRTPWDDAKKRTPTQDFLRQTYLDNYSNKHPALSSTGETEFINSHVPESCPYCKADEDKLVRKGFTKNGVCRYRCNKCGRTFTPITGTIFDGHKISISEWESYLLNLFSYVSLNAGSMNNKNAPSTSRYWLQKVFMLLHQYYQSTPVLEGRIYLDETYYSVIRKDRMLKEDGTEPRGLSSNKICIGVARGNGMTYCAIVGKAKPSKKKIWEAFGSVIAPGSTLIHDAEKSHRILVERLNLIDDVHPTSETKNLDDKDNPLRDINRTHFFLKKFLTSHSGFSRNNLPGYLDLFSFIMNPPTNHLEKVELLMEMAFEYRQILRFRDLFSKDNRGDWDDETPF